jgi:hypothetical protein
MKFQRPFARAQLAKIFLCFSNASKMSSSKVIFTKILHMCGAVTAQTSNVSWSQPNNNHCGCFCRLGQPHTSAQLFPDKGEGRTATREPTMWFLPSVCLAAAVGIPSSFVPTKAVFDKRSSTTQPFSYTFSSSSCLTTRVIAVILPRVPKCVE